VIYCYKEREIIMFISSWVLCSIGIILWLGLIFHFGKPISEFDFVSPAIGLVIFFIGISFMAGYLIK
jgi:hypothetical protein